MIKSSIEILEQIGEGFVGIIYKCKINNKPAVYKLRKSNDYHNGLISDFNREIDFSNFTKQYPDYFMVL